MTEVSSPLAPAHKPLIDIDFGACIITKKMVKINENLFGVALGGPRRTFLSTIAG